MKCPYITKTGDKGKTSIMNSRVNKNSSIIKFLGALDEVNSYFGLIINYAPEELTKTFLNIQNQLLNIGGFISGGNIEITTEYHEWIEKNTDIFFSNLTNANNFVLPGGSILSSHLHIVRCIIRRSETLLWEIENNNENIAKYINRLSDFVFVLGRLYSGDKEHLWKVGKITL